MVLGYAAIERGDRGEAVRRLGAAAEAPVTDQLRYSQLDMSLPARLIDAGERDAVADFLERCAKFSGYGREYADWAKQIRRGVNPRMGPMHMVFGRVAPRTASPAYLLKNRLSPAKSRTAIFRGRGSDFGR
jgi:hypothetical protein